MKKYAVIPVLAACLLLTACERQPERIEQSETEEQTEILLTVDGREVPAWRYLCWLSYGCRQILEQYAAAGQEIDWSMPVEDGTLADYVKAQALADTVLYATVENWAERYGCEVAEGAELPPEAMPLTGLSEEQIRELQQVGKQYACLYELYCTEGSPLAPRQETLEAFAKERGVMTLDRILVTAGEDREGAMRRAAELFSRLNEAESAAEMFSTLAAEGNDLLGPRLDRDCGWEESLLAAGRSLEVGQYSGILESGEGFSILMRLETDPSVLKEEHFDSLLQDAASAAAVAVQPRYHELEPADVCKAGRKG